MNCKICNTNNKPDSRYCYKCGNSLEVKDLGSVDTYFAKQLRGCQICGSIAPTKEIVFYQNIGMLLMRRYASIKGRLCKKCINREFKEKTAITLILGWWSYTSLVYTPIYLINNIARYCTTIGMKKD